MESRAFFYPLVGDGEQSFAFIDDNQVIVFPDNVEKRVVEFRFPALEADPDRIAGL